MNEIKEIEIELNDEELHWLDYGGGFNSLEEWGRETYDEITWSIRKKIEKVYSEDGELHNDDKNKLKLTNHEVNYIGKILTDLIVNFYHEYLDKSDKEGYYYFQENTLPTNNSILNKLGRPTLLREDLRLYCLRKRLNDEI